MIGYSKSYKKTIIMTVLVILLCLISLAGATLALFTNDLNDGTIGIITTAGSVKVDIVDTSSEENSLVGKVLLFYTSSERKEILFEPGATIYTQGFKVKNLGSVPINFRLYISRNEIETDETGSLHLDGYDKLDHEAFKRAFDVWITTDPSDPEKHVGIEEFVGSLGADGNAYRDEDGSVKTNTVTEETYYLVIRMKKDVDNEFQGKYYTGIGVTVYAVQGNVFVEE